MRHYVIIFFYIFSSMAMASSPVSGSFEATKLCPAYVSKNKKSNPDNLMVTPPLRYVLHEINRPHNPDWIRISFPDNQQPLRWVSAACGVATYQSQEPKSCDNNPGLANYNVIAFSWQPAFCATYGYEAGKPECLHLKSTFYSANHLVLHGLWPSQESCGVHYGFCGIESQTNHCDYPAVNLTPDVANTLRVLMPSFAFGSCLERHEWNKHGSCQLLASSEYFAQALRLTNDVNETPFGQYLHEHIGQRVSKVDLEETIKASFGDKAIRKVYLGCKNGLLVDIFIQLPAVLPESDSLVTLVKNAAEVSHPSGCPQSIGISDFTGE